MTRPHDMGGRFGDGPVVPEPERPVFHADWHKRALAVTLACGAFGKWNLDISRHARERLAPTDYARFSYYEKWIAAWRATDIPFARQTKVWFPEPSFRKTRRLLSLDGTEFSKLVRWLTGHAFLGLQNFR